jgi:hypothetical protein
MGKRLHVFFDQKSVRIFQYISNKKQRYTVYFIWKLFNIFRLVLPPIIRSPYKYTYSIWYLSHRYGCPPLAADSSNGLTNTICCRYNSNKLTKQIQQFYEFITWRFVSLNLFRAPPRLSSWAYNCIISLWSPEILKIYILHLHMKFT